jgi:hypothetical protein
MSTGDDLVLGKNNSAEDPTRIECTPIGVNQIGLDVVNLGQSGFGIQGGVNPTLGAAKDNIAVSGFCGGSVEGIGAQGEASQGVGVQGMTSHGIGVKGLDQGKQAVAGIGVLGTTTFGTGVSGSSSSGVGVSGSSSSAAGVNGNSGADRGGVFGSGKVAQLQLTPISYNGSLPPHIPGKMGDLLAINTVSSTPGGHLCSLWFCVTDGLGGASTWKKVSLT